MLSPKLKLPMSNCQVIEQNNQDSRCNTIRIALLVWAFLRLAVSVIWTVLLILVTIDLYQLQNAKVPNSYYYLEPFAIFLQLIEFGMLVTFIVAGFKKNASLYLVYYWYCIVTLIIYVIAVTLCLLLNYQIRRDIGELYMLYNVFNTAVVIGNNKLAYLIASIFDFGLEILLIYLIKMLINNYRYYGNEYVAGETV